MNPNPPIHPAAQILVVDDEAVTRMMIRRVLEDSGCRVLEAGHGEEALALAEQHCPDLVLMDVRMPRMNGFSRHCDHNPTTPCGSHKVTPTNKAPRKNNQYSGNAWVKKLFDKLTMKAPITGPTKVARPPTATQIAISMELAGDISPGLMMPTCGTYSAPAIPQRNAESVHAASL